MRFVAIIASSLFVLLAMPGRASANRSEAARLFQEAERRADQGQHAEAADRYEAAFGLVPSSIALMAATNERMLARQWEEATALVERLSAYRDELEVDAFARSTEAELLTVRTRLVVRCVPACRVATNQEPASQTLATEQRIWLEPHDVTLLWVGFANGTLVEREVELGSGEHELVVMASDEVRLDRESPPTSERAEDPLAARVADAAPGRRRSHRARIGVLTAVGTSVVLDGLALWANARSFRAQARYAADPTLDTWEPAVSGQRVAVGVSTAAALATSAAIASGVTFRLRGRVRPTPGIEVLPAGAVVSLGGSF